MREILFRGKTNYEGRDSEWIYGSLLAESKNTFPIIARDYDNDEEWIGIIEWVTVDPETVGQYTGLTDKNGKKIFEGDIHERSNHLFIVKYGKFNSEGYGWYFESVKDGNCEHFYGDENDYVNIIGNIHDNPELIKT